MSLNTTQVVVWVSASGTSAMIADSWWVSLSARGNQSATPPSFDAGGSVLDAAGSDALSPGGAGVRLELYSSLYAPPAPPTTVRLQVVPSETSLNANHFFNLSAKVHRAGQPDITRSIETCVYVPPRPSFGVWNTSGAIQAPPDSYVRVTFRLQNTGNTADFYWCSGDQEGDPWSWGFTEGVSFVAGTNRTPNVEPNQNLTIRMTVYVPPTAPASANTTLSLDCQSFKQTTMNLTVLLGYPPFTRVEVPLYRYMCVKSDGDPAQAAMPGDTVVFNITFENRANGPDSGRASITEGNQSWVEAFGPTNFTLQASGFEGSTVPAALTLKIPLQAPVFTYTFTIEVTSTTGPAPFCSLHLRVAVQQVYSIAAPGGAPITANIGDSLTSSFSIKNTGNGLDNLAIQATADTGWKVLLSPTISSKLLQVGEQSQFLILIEVPEDLANATAGLHSVVVRVTSSYAQMDGLDVHVDIVWLVTVRPFCSIALSPADIYADVNPWQSPSGPFRASWTVALRNQGNARAALVFGWPGGSPVPISSSLNGTELVVGESAEARITAEIPRDTPSGLLEIPFAYSACDGSVLARGWVHVQIQLVDVVVDAQVKASVQDPQEPMATPPSNEVTSIDQVETFHVRFSVRLSNAGDMEILPSLFELRVFDEFACPGPMRGPSPTGCGISQLGSVRLTTALQPGEERWVTFDYRVPEFACFESRPCAVDDLPDNVHTLRFQAVVANESNLQDNEATVVVHSTRMPSDPAPRRTANAAPVVVGAGIAALLSVAGLVIAYLRATRRAARNADPYSRPSKRR